MKKIIRGALALITASALGAGLLTAQAVPSDSFDRTTEENRSIQTAIIDTTMPSPHTELYYDSTSGEWLIVAGTFSFNAARTYTTYYYRWGGKEPAERLKVLKLSEDSRAGRFYGIDSRQNVSQEEYLSAYEALLQNKTECGIGYGAAGSDLQKPEDFIKQFQSGLQNRRVTLWEAGSTETLHSGLQLTPEDTDEGRITIEWTSSDPSVAVVDEMGRVEAVSKGTCTVTASLKDSEYRTAVYDVFVEN